MFHQPNTEFGSRYNGALRNDWPNYLVDNLATIKARGGKVVLMMVGQQKYYKNADGTFSLSSGRPGSTGTARSTSPNTSTTARSSGTT